MSNKTITAFAPATIANFNVGYDILGVSLCHIGDEVTLTRNGTSENRMVKIWNGENLPKEADKNCCTVVIQAMQDALGDKQGVDVILKKGFAAGSGLGSSSASSAAAAFAYNALVGEPFSRKELVFFAAQGEKIACGTAHIDNVAPSILGGIVLATGHQTEDIIMLPILEDMYAVSLFPEIKVKTADSRKILKKNVSIPTYVQQVGCMGAFVSSLYEQDWQRFTQAMQDIVIEPMRSLLIPQFDILKTVALAQGAAAFGISGSGPSVFAITKGEEAAQHIRTEMEKVYTSTDILTQSYCNPITRNSGARLINL